MRRRKGCTAKAIPACVSRLVFSLPRTVLCNLPIQRMAQTWGIVHQCLPSLIESTESAVLLVSLSIMADYEVVKSITVDPGSEIEFERFKEWPYQYLVPTNFSDAALRSRE